MNRGDIKTFDTKKHLTYMKDLGQGGTGDTHLFKDETTDMYFAVKKYVPKNKELIDEYYRRFVDEIKILLNISHPNVVRIYTYYLFPEHKTGFIQMEYIDGYSIDKFDPSLPWETKGWVDIFREVISAFGYLEQNHILHRDIRPANILIDNGGNVKVIDFGFGKQLDGNRQDENSVLLNWPVTEWPDELNQTDHEYDNRTEVYFVGTLFRRILEDDIDTFQFRHIIDKMTKVNPTERYRSFAEIANVLSAGVLGEIDFSDKQKEVYRNFASALVNRISDYKLKYSPINNVQVTLSKLEELIRLSSLEEYIQSNDLLINCFISGRYSYHPQLNVKVKTVIDFYKLLTSLTSSKQKILLDNIYNRLSLVRVDVDDLPF